MRILVFFFCCIAWPLLAHTNLTTQIYDVDLGNKMGDEVLILLKSGGVLKLGKWDSELIEKLCEAKSSNEVFQFVVNQDRYVVAAKSKGFLQEDKIKGSVVWDEEYVPTTVKDLDTARKYFRESPYNPKESQCFNRAHVWTYEWAQNHQLKSMKLLIFFTRNYIRAYNFEWWFHISPYVHVVEFGKTVEKVMDVKYTRGPLNFRTWTNIFMKNDAECPVVTKYSDYADYPYTGDCFIMRTNMYTYQPADLEMQEAFGYQKTGWIDEEVRGAYAEAFDMILKGKE